MMKEYIEREAVIERLKKNCPNDYYASVHHVIRTYPAADVEPVRHGEWREETEYYDDEYSEYNIRKVFVCSLCGRTERIKQPYCNCGAKMDGGKK